MSRSKVHLCTCVCINSTSKYKYEHMCILYLNYMYISTWLRTSSTLLTIVTYITHERFTHCISYNVQVQCTCICAYICMYMYITDNTISVSCTWKYDGGLRCKNVVSVYCLPKSCPSYKKMKVANSTQLNILPVLFIAVEYTCMCVEYRKSRNVGIH